VQYRDRVNTAGSNLLREKSELPLTLILTDGKIWPHKGYIVFVDRQMNQQTGAIRIAASFPNPGNVLRSGQFGRVTLVTGDRLRRRIGRLQGRRHFADELHDGFRRRQGAKETRRELHHHLLDLFLGWYGKRLSEALSILTFQ
jgi:hypothetical protein